MKFWRLLYSNFFSFRKNAVSKKKKNGEKTLFEQLPDFAKGGEKQVAASLQTLFFFQFFGVFSHQTLLDLSTLLLKEIFREKEEGFFWKFSISLLIETAAANLTFLDNWPPAETQPTPRQRGGKNFLLIFLHSDDTISGAGRGGGKREGDNHRFPEKKEYSKKKVSFFLTEKEDRIFSL